MKAEAEAGQIVRTADIADWLGLSEDGSRYCTINRLACRKRLGGMLRYYYRDAA